MALRSQFEWLNCYGDVISHRYSQVVLDYWEKIVLPALSSAEQEVKHWERSEEDFAPFVHSIKLDQHRITASSMCISLQSIWERQFRTYLIHCVEKSATSIQEIEKIQRADWFRLQEIFEKSRGVKLQAFKSYMDLNLLMKLANICRHGDGSSANKLWKSNPEFWADCAWHAQADVAPSAQYLHISTMRLAKFSESIAGFWSMVEYLYNESIKIKHASLERKLIDQRKEKEIEIEHFNAFVEKIK